jgi:hypothetical protein
MPEPTETAYHALELQAYARPYSPRNLAPIDHNLLIIRAPL